MNRRLQAAGDIELVHLAALAARGEGKPAGTIEELTAGGFLPVSFGRRPDGSRTVYENSNVYDSLRGGRGSFLPVPDVKLTGATAAECEDFRALAEYARSHVQRLEPVLAGIERSLLPDGRHERVTIDLRVSPFADQQNAFLAQWLSGEPDQQRLAPMPGDLVTLEAMLAGHHVFAGLRDCNPLPFMGGLGGNSRNLAGMVIGSLLTPPTDSLMGYLGAADARGLGFLDDLGFGPIDADGYSRTRGPVWRRQQGPLVVLSFHRQVLEAVTPLMQFEDAVRPAHARARVGDLRQSQLANFLDTLGARRAEATSLGNLRLLNSLTQQLHVPPEQALSAAERVLDARLVCPLGGQYELKQPQEGPAAWRSTSARASGPYRFPMLNWFRGLGADAVLDGPAVVAHIELVMQPLSSKAPRTPAEEVPSPKAPESAATR
jgi:hypothetical protein